MTTGKINFGAGPAALPPEVLYEVSKAVIKYKKTGYSILELPHRSKEFGELLDEANALVKELCGLGTQHVVLWMHGGGRAQFAMVPMNFLKKGQSAAYIDSGHWAHEAFNSAQETGQNAIVAGSTKNEGYNHLPAIPGALPAECNYLHITTNNTIYGTQYHQDPEVTVPVIADMSSDIFSCQRNFARYALIYAVAQKNLGTPGVTLVIADKNLIDSSNADIPSVFSYAKQVKEKNLYNTPNVSGIYTSLLMLRWIKKRGLAAIQSANEAKAKMLYDAIDAHPLFTPHVTQVADRSTMNVVFTAKDKETENKFLQLCHSNNIVGIEGHRSVGGFRVSLYNAIEPDDVKTLVDLMGRM